MNNEECAKVFVEAIKTIASKPENLQKIGRASCRERV